MTMVSITPSRAARPVSQGIVARVREFFARSRTYRTTFKELSALSEYELNDIGLSRSMIHDVARETAYGR